MSGRHSTLTWWSTWHHTITQCSNSGSNTPAFLLGSGRRRKKLGRSNSKLETSHTSESARSSTSSISCSVLTKTMVHSLRHSPQVTSLKYSQLTWWWTSSTTSGRHSLRECIEQGWQLMSSTCSSSFFTSRKCTCKLKAEMRMEKLLIHLHMFGTYTWFQAA